MGKTFENKLENSFHFNYWESGHERRQIKRQQILMALAINMSIVIAKLYCTVLSQFPETKKKNKKKIISK